MVVWYVPAAWVVDTDDLYVIVVISPDIAIVDFATTSPGVDVTNAAYSFAPNCVKSESFVLYPQPHWDAPWQVPVHAVGLPLVAFQFGMVIVVAPVWRRLSV